MPPVIDNCEEIRQAEQGQDDPCGRLSLEDQHKQGDCNGGYTVESCFGHADTDAAEDKGRPLPGEELIGDNAYKVHRAAAP
jgi:hypothetical protein